jgi:hypothetical protein
MYMFPVESKTTWSGKSALASTEIGVTPEGAASTRTLTTRGVMTTSTAKKAPAARAPSFILAESISVTGSPSALLDGPYDPIRFEEVPDSNRSSGD